MRKIIILTFAIIAALIAAYSYNQNIAIASSPIVNVPAETDAPLGDAEHGQELFKKGANGAPPCVACHAYKAEGSTFSVGPNLFEVSERAETRVEDLSAHDYLHESIVDPGSFVVSGYRNIMYKDFAEKYSEQDIEDLIAFLDTLK